jgi:hypothetical protein
MLKTDSKIFVAYEDADSFSAIPKFHGFPEAMPQIPNQEEMDTVVFSEFWTEKSWANAVTAVTGADMIIVSLSGRADLPVPVQRWMESWPNYEPASHPTLVVVFGTELTEDSRQNVLISYFQKIAENHGLDFLCNCEGAKSLPAHSEPSGRVNQIEPSDPSLTARYPAFSPLAALKAA